MRKMKMWIIIVAISAGLLSGCVGFSEKSKLEKYGRTLDSYESAMRVSDLDALSHFVDPKAMSRQDCLNRFGEIKIVEYKVMDVQVDEEDMEVTQEIKVSYHFLNGIRLKDRTFSQTWHYLEDSEQWLLKDGPPQFE